MSNTNLQTMTDAELLAYYQAENVALKQAMTEQAKVKDSDRTSLGEGLTCKVSEKGAVSIYGFSSKGWPITLYKSQFYRLLKVMKQLEAFYAANDAKLSVKAVVEAVPKK